MALNLPQMTSDAVDKIGFENLPNVYFRKIKIRKCDEQNVIQVFFDEIQLSLFDYKKERESVWLKQKMLSQFLKVRVTFVACYTSKHKAEIQEVLNGNLNLKELEELRGDTAPGIGSAVVRASIFTSNSATTDFREPAGTIAKFTKTVNLSKVSIAKQLWDQDGGTDIYIFAQMFIDVGELKNQFNADFDYTAHQHYLGPLRAEKVYSNSQESSKSSVFYTTKGFGSTTGASHAPATIQGDLDRVSYGAIHENSSLGWMEGSFHSGRSHEVLNLMEITTQLKISHGECWDGSVEPSHENLPGIGLGGLTQAANPSVPTSDVNPDADGDGVWWELADEGPSPATDTVDENPPPTGSPLGSGPGAATDSVADDDLEVVKWGKVPWQGSMPHGQIGGRSSKRGGSGKQPDYLMTPEMSLSEDGSVNLITAINYNELLLQNDDVSRILFQRNPMLFGSVANLITIDSLSLKRKPIHSRDRYNRLGTRAGSYPAVSHETETLVQTAKNNDKFITKSKFILEDGSARLIDPKDIKGSFVGDIGDSITIDSLDGAIEVANIKEIKLTGNPNLGFLAFKDYSVGLAGGKEFQYGIEVSFVSKTTEFIRDVIATLDSLAKDVWSFYQAANLPGSYDHVEMSWKKDFFVAINNHFGYNIEFSENKFNFTPSSSSTKDAIWVKAPPQYFAGLGLIGNPKEEVVTKMFSLLCPISSSPEKILRAHRIFMNLITSIRKIYNLDNDKSRALGGASTDKKGIKTRTGTPTNKHKVERFFKQSINILQPKAFGYNFIGVMDESFPVITKKGFNKRVEQERKKFFKSSPTTESKELSNISPGEKAALVDLDSCYSFFTPKNIIIGKEKKELSQISEKVFDNKFFDRFSLMNSTRLGGQKGFGAPNPSIDGALATATSTFNFTITPSVPSTLQNLLDVDDKFTDVRNYLGDETSLTIEKSSAKLIIPSFSKEEKKNITTLITNFSELKTSSSENKKLSLGNFNLKNKNSNFSHILGKSNSAKKLKNLPVSIKALLLDSKDNKTVRHSMVGGDFDPIRGIQTKEAIRQNFLNVRKLQYLAGFGMTNGAPDIGKPVWKLMNSEIAGHPGNQLCRLSPFHDQDLGIGSVKEDAPTFDSLFIMKGEK